MRMFTESPEALSNELLLWNKPSSNVSVEDCYELKIYPRESISKYGPTTFVIPPQPQGMLTNVDVVTTFKLQNSSGGDVSVADQTTVINGIIDSIIFWIRAHFLLSLCLFSANLFLIFKLKKSN